MKFVSVFALSLILIAGCGGGKTEKTTASKGGAPTDALVFINVTSDVAKDPQKVDMAMKIGKFSLEEGRRVFYFFNVKAVHIPCTKFDAKVAFKGQEPIKKQLQALIDKGAVVHVCPVCMKALGVEKKDIMDGAQVTTKAGLFSKIKSDTVVFTY